MHTKVVLICLIVEFTAHAKLDVTVMLTSWLTLFHSIMRHGGACCASYKAACTASPNQLCVLKCV